MMVRTENKTRRVTIVIDDDLDRKLRLKQAKKIQTTNNTVSYSRVINDTLRKSMK